MTLLWIALIVAIVCIIPVSYAVVVLNIRSSDQMVKFKRYRFNGRYLLIAAFRRDSHSYVDVSIENNEGTVGNKNSINIYRYKYNEYFESDDDAIRAATNIIVASFRNAINHIQKEQDANQQPKPNDANSNDGGKCNVRCPDGCDCIYWENTEM